MSPLPILFPDRRPVRAIPMYNGDPAHPWGLSAAWTNGGVPWLIETMEHAYGKGFRRFMWTLPAGRFLEPHTPFPSAQWHVLDESGIHSVSQSVRDDLHTLVGAWLKERRDARIIVYLGGVIKSAYDRDVTGAHVPNPASVADVKLMNLNFNGFLAIRPDTTTKSTWVGFWLDNSSPPEKRDGEYRVVEWLRSRGIWGGMEAVANDGIGIENNPNPGFAEKVPMFGIRSFWEPVVQYPDPNTLPPVVIALTKARAGWTFDRQKTEVGFFLHGFPDGPFSLSEGEGHDKLQHYHDRGCILGTYVERWEDHILSIVAASP